MDMELAVALFERGYPNARVEQALRHCTTLEAAIEWLSSAGAAETDAESVVSSRPDAEAVAGQGTARRRRMVSKQPSEPAAVLAKDPASAPGAAAAQAPKKDVAPAAGDAASPAASLASAPGPSNGASPSPSSPASASAADAGLGAQGKATAATINIEARDAKDWWSNKRAALWKQRAAVPALGSMAVSPSSSRAREVSVGGGEAQEEAEEEAEEEERPGSAGAASSAAASSAAPPPEAPGSAPQDPDPPGQRPVATPCGAPLAIESTGLAEASPIALFKRPETPGTSSPRGMRLNRTEEQCGICCNDIPAARAVKFGCSHGWYCGQCVKKHAEARLAMGASSVTCPECCTPLPERDLRKLVPQDIMDRLHSRSLEQAVSSAADLWACPTPNCPMRVALEEGQLPRLKCTICNKTSCLKCGIQPWHRGLTCEEARSRQGVGKKRKQNEGVDELMKWIEETGTKQCPTCRMAVSKQKLESQHTQYSECHKMCCRNCGTKFCFKCLAVLTDTYTCGCSINAHGFIDPTTGKRLNHLRRGAAKAKSKGKAASKRKAGH